MVYLANPSLYSDTRDLYVNTCDHLLFIATATTQIYTLSLHDALPISTPSPLASSWIALCGMSAAVSTAWTPRTVLAALTSRSEEHTSELQSRQYLVCRLLLEKKNACPVHRVA